MKIRLSLLLLASATAFLAGCGADEATVSAQSDDVNTALPGEDIQSPAAPDAGLSISHIGSCADVEPVMAPFITGLVEMEGNSVNEFGVSCTWTMAEGNTDWSNAREISLGITPVYAGDPKPSVAELQQVLPGTTEVTSDWISSHDGVAYETRMGSDVIGAIVSTVWTPSFQVSVSGGAWEGHQTLDGNAAAQIAQQIFG